MAIAIQWQDDRKTIILQRFEGTWTWEEFYLSSQESTALIRTVDHQVHIIADFTASGSLPLGGAISHAHSVLNHIPANWGILIIVSNNMLINVLVNAFTKTFRTGMGAKTFTAKNIEEAHKVIAQQSLQQSL